MTLVYACRRRPARSARASGATPTRRAALPAALLTGVSSRRMSPSTFLASRSTLTADHLYDYPHTAPQQPHDDAVIDLVLTGHLRPFACNQRRPPARISRQPHLPVFPIFTTQEHQSPAPGSCSSHLTDARGRGFRRCRPKRRSQTRTTNGTAQKARFPLAPHRVKQRPSCAWRHIRPREQMALWRQKARTKRSRR